MSHDACICRKFSWFDTRKPLWVVKCFVSGSRMSKWESVNRVHKVTKRCRSGGKLVTCIAMTCIGTTCINRKKKEERLHLTSAGLLKITCVHYTEPMQNVNLQSAEKSKKLSGMKHLTKCRTPCPGGHWGCLQLPLCHTMQSHEHPGAHMRTWCFVRHTINIRGQVRAGHNHHRAGQSRSELRSSGLESVEESSDNSCPRGPWS